MITVTHSTLISRAIEMPKERTYRSSFAREIKLLILNTKIRISEGKEQYLMGRGLRRHPKLDIVNEYRDTTYCYVDSQ